MSGPDQLTAPPERREPAPRRAPGPRQGARHPSLPPWPWLAAPLVVGLLASGLLLRARHENRPALWCRRSAPVMAALDRLEESVADPEALPALAEAVTELDLPLLMPDLPPDLAERLAEDARLWPVLARRAAEAPPGSSFLEVAPYPILDDVTGYRARYAQECLRL